MNTDPDKTQSQSKEAVISKDQMHEEDTHKQMGSDSVSFLGFHSDSVEVLSSGIWHRING
jgi:hypothetical protein